LRAEGAYLNNGYISGDFYATSLHAGGEDLLNKIKQIDEENIELKQ